MVCLRLDLLPKSPQLSKDALDGRVSLPLGLLRFSNHLSHEYDNERL